MAPKTKNTETGKSGCPKVNTADLPREQRIDAVLERFRELFPHGDFGRRISKEEEERILGFDPD